MKTILILAVIGGFIGYITNAVAVYLLFRPYEKVGPFQGLIPRRKAELAASLGRTIENELINLDGIITNVVDELDLEKVKQEVAAKLSKALKEELPAIVPPALIDSLVSKYIERRGDELFQDLIHSLSQNTSNLQVVSRHVEQKILELDLARVEELVYEVARTQLQFIIWLGGVLGFIIGVIQGLLVIYVL